MKNPENPMCDYQEMLHKGFDAIPYIIWPKDLIDIVIAGIKERKALDIAVYLRSGSMKIECTELISKPQP